MTYKSNLSTKSSKISLNSKYAGLKWLILFLITFVKGEKYPNFLEMYFSISSSE